MGMGIWPCQEMLTVPQYEHTFFVLGIEMDQSWICARYVAETDFLSSLTAGGVNICSLIQSEVYNALSTSLK